MANEAVIIEINNNNAIRFTCTTGAAADIKKGDLCTVSDPRTAAKGTGLRDVVAGIAAADQVSGATSITCYVPNQGNIFDLKANTTIAVGTMVCISGANMIISAEDADFEAGQVLGRALEAASGDETIAVLV